MKCQSAPHLHVCKSQSALPYMFKIQSILHTVTIQSAPSFHIQESAPSFPLPVHIYISSNRFYHTAHIQLKSMFIQQYHMLPCPKIDVMLILSLPPSIHIYS